MVKLPTAPLLHDLAAAAADPSASCHALNTTRLMTTCLPVLLLGCKSLSVHCP